MSFRLKWCVFTLWLCSAASVAQSAPPRCEAVVIPIVLDTSKPAPASVVMIRRFARCARQGGEQVRLSAHLGSAAKQRNPEYAIAISQRMGEAIRKRLVTQGVQKKRIEVRGYGVEVPLCRDKTRACRARNNRVEVRLAE